VATTRRMTHRRRSSWLFVHDGESFVLPSSHPTSLTSPRHLVFKGPVHRTEKKTEIGLN
jgi:hypothetical protein